MTRQWKDTLLDIYLANIFSFLHDLSSPCLNRHSEKRREKLLFTLEPSLKFFFNTSRGVSGRNTGYLITFVNSLLLFGTVIYF